MVNFSDGPASGITLMLHRAPLYLRVVCNRYGKKKEFDALDQLDDVPKAGEDIYAYRRVSSAGRVHIRATKASGYYAMATYEMIEHQPEDAIMRKTKLWQDYARQLFATLNLGVQHEQAKTRRTESEDCRGEAEKGDSRSSGNEGDRQSDLPD